MVELPDDWDSIPMIEDVLAAVTASLREDGWFIPFAIAVDNSGESTGLYPEPADEWCDNVSAFEALVDALRGKAGTGELEPAALIVDTHVGAGPEGDQQDAIRVHLGFREGDAQRTVLPYDLEERTGDGATHYHLELGSPETMPVQPMIFDLA